MFNDKLIKANERVIIIKKNCLRTFCHLVNNTFSCSVQIFSLKIKKDGVEIICKLK